MLIGGANRGQRLRPKIPNFQNERHSMPLSEPATGEPDQQLRRRRDHHVRAGQEHAAAGS
jgi:hypothetical protein